MKVKWKSNTLPTLYTHLGTPLTAFGSFFRPFLPIHGPTHVPLNPVLPLQLSHLSQLYYLALYLDNGVN